MTRLGIALWTLAALAAAGCSEDGESPGDERAGDEIATPEQPAPASEDEPASEEQGATVDQGEDAPLWLRLRPGDERIPIRAVAIDLSETGDRVLFFRDEVECEGIPRTDAEKEADETIVVATGVDPISPDLVGRLHPTEWYWEHEPQQVQPADEWGIELEQPSGDKKQVEGRVDIRTSEQGDYAFELEGEFSAIVCGPDTG